MKIIDPAIQTTSGLKAWYLTTFGGKRVRAVYCLPILHSLGRISYRRRWILVPA